LPSKSALCTALSFIEIVGEAGAGKSRLIEFMWKLSGRPDYEGFDANKSTNVAVYRNFAQISNLPVVLIEATVTTKTVILWVSLSFHGMN
jgi:ABC-type transport system involved in cytochrome bd biosynthesis fused ATPase/permease subunit